jgi:hypothetical protein
MISDDLSTRIDAVSVPTVVGGTDADDVPVLLLPCKRADLPTRCPRAACGSRMLLTSTYYAGLDLTGEIVCGLCSRTVARLLQRAPRLQLSPADLAPQKRGRPRGTALPCARCGTTARWAGRVLCHACMVADNKMLPCSNCLVNPRMSDRQHCQPCRSARRKANGWVS